uniref:Integrase catalytic domain-containing protein n=1 Tax=Tanacetum cinerariifolium TaxID=118510 RepID=A0A6L2N5S7_TANCI|nr:hypothetical protein [Tanacetum cinerariifolium]
MELETTQTSTTAKLHMLKQGDYEMRRLKIEQYFQVQDYALWDVIESGNSFVPVTQTATVEDGTITTTISSPVTAEEKNKKKNDVKARSMLLMALPNEHVMTFNQYMDAKSLSAAIETRFGGNEATKKIQKTLLKQMYENFSATSTKSLDYIFNRLQKIRNKSDLDTMSIDDLYNNFKIVEQKVKGNASSNSSSQNMAFVSSPSTNSTNDVYTAYGLSTASTQSSNASIKISTTSSQTSTANLSDATVGPRNQDSRNRYQDSSRRTVNVEETPPKAMVAIDGLGFDWSHMAKDEAPINMARSQITDNSKKGLGYESYHAVPPPPTGLFLPLKTDLSYSGLEEFKQPHFESYGPKSCEKESKNVSKDIPNEPKEYHDAHLVKDRVSDNKDYSGVSPVVVEKKTDVPTIAKVKVIRPKQQEKPVRKTVRYAEMYRSQGPIGNQRNWNDLKSQQLGKDMLPLGEELMVAELLVNELLKLVLLKVLRRNNMYNVDMKNIVPKESLTCLVVKATLDESMLWHMRLGHINFKNINKLVKDKLVRATKNENTCILKKFITEIENLVDKKVKVIRCDNETKFKNSVMNDFCAMKDIRWEFSVAKTPQQNGVAERRNITLIEAARTMVLVVMPHNKTPYDLFRGRTPALRFMRPFGCHVTILNTLDHLGRRVEENLHVRFLEDKPIIAGAGPKWLFDIDMLTKLMNYVSVIAGTNSDDFADGSPLFDSSPKISDDVGSSSSSDAGKKHDEVLDKERKTHEDLNTCLFACFLSQIEPIRVAKPLSDPAWVEAMNKKDKRGIVIKNKTRLVAQGYTQEEGIDYDEVFSLVARIKAIRMFLAYASFMGFMVYKMDVKSALYMEGLKRSQDKYVTKVLRKFNLSDVKSSNTPVDTENTLVKDADGADVDVHLYRSMIGLFMYLIASRPDIIDSPFELVVYTDSDYAGDSLDMKSTTRGCQFLGSRLISWQCKKQIVVATSISEAKYERMIADLDADEGVALVDETQGRNDQDMFDTSISDDEEVVAEKEVSTADPVPTTGEVVTTVDVEVSADAITFQISMDEITLTKALIDIKTSKPKVKGIVMKEPSETPTQTLKDTSQQSSKAKDKGKAKMTEPEKPLKRKDQIMINKEIARNLEARLQAELEEEDILAKGRKRQHNFD